MTDFYVPTKDKVSKNNQELFNLLEKNLGKVPNLYAIFTYHETALADYIALQKRDTTLTAKEKEAINLIVSQINNCEYCLAAHSMLAKKAGFSDQHILEIRSGSATFDNKINALIKFSAEIVLKNGRPSDQAISNFFEIGYDKASLIDVIMTIGSKLITNYLHTITKIPIDFPLAQNMEEEVDK